MGETADSSESRCCCRSRDRPGSTSHFAERRDSLGPDWRSRSKHPALAHHVLFAYVEGGHRARDERTGEVEEFAHVHLAVQGRLAEAYRSDGGGVPGNVRDWRWEDTPPERPARRDDGVDEGAICPRLRRT